MLKNAALQRTILLSLFFAILILFDIDFPIYENFQKENLYKNLSVYIYLSEYKIYPIKLCSFFVIKLQRNR